MSKARADEGGLRPRCPVCLRPFDSTPRNDSRDVCWREAGSGEFWQPADEIECWRLGYERLKAAAAETLGGAAFLQGKAEGRKEAAGAMCWRCKRNPQHADAEHCSAWPIRALAEGNAAEPPSKDPQEDPQP